MKTYLDGYNLLFHIYPGETGLKELREWLIADLEEKLSLLNTEATVVFDAHRSPECLSISHQGPLRIIYTSPGQTADEYLLELIHLKKNRKNSLVVTSDRSLARQIKEMGGRTEGVMEYFAKLHSRFQSRKRKRYSSQPKSLPKTFPTDDQENFTHNPYVVEGSEEYYLKIFEERFRKLEEDGKS